MGIKVTEMTEATQVNNNDLFMIVQNGENKKITKENLQGSIVDAELEERVDTLEDDVEALQGDIETLNSEVEALQEENEYLNNLVEQAFDKKEVEGEELSIDDTINAKMEVGLEGNTTQETTTGKNLLQNKLTSGTYNGITYVVNEDKSVTLSGTASAVTWLMLNNSITLEAGTYTVSSGINSNIIRLYCDAMGGYISNGIKTTTLTETKTSDISINIPNGTAITTPITIYPMVEKSSTKTDYEKYTGGIASPNPSYPSNVNVVTGDNTIVVSNKNKFNFEDLLSKIQTFTISGNASEFTINGVGTYQYPISITTEEIVSGRWSSTNLNGDVKVIYEDDTNANIFSSYSSSSVSGNINFVPTKKVKAIQFRTYNNNNIKFNNFQIEKGSTATPYEEHQEQTFQINLGNIELCGIGDYRDYLYKSNNKWYLHKQIGKVVLDGSENFIGAGTSGTDYRYNKTLSSLNIPNATTNNALCMANYFQNVTIKTDKKWGAFYINGNWLVFYDKDNNFENATAFNTWLSTHNTLIYYVLATPTNTEITDTTLISQLEALKTAMSYAQQTNISQINGDVPFILQVTALASYNSRILALENAILNANRNVSVENTRKSNEVIEEPKEEVEEPKEENKEER